MQLKFSGIAQCLTSLIDYIRFFIIKKNPIFAVNCDFFGQVGVYESNIIQYNCPFFLEVDGF